MNVGQNSVTKYQKRMKKVKGKTSGFFFRIYANNYNWKLVRCKDNFEKSEI